MEAASEAEEEEEGVGGLIEVGEKGVYSPASLRRTMQKWRCRHDARDERKVRVGEGGGRGTHT